MTERCERLAHGPTQYANASNSRTASGGGPLASCRKRHDPAVRVTAAVQAGKEILIKEDYVYL